MKRLFPLAAMAMMACGGGGPATKVTVLITTVDDAPASTRAVAAATVTVHVASVVGLGSPIATLKTDDQGRAEVDLNPGTYTFCFVNGSGRNACKALAVPSAESVLVAYADGFVQDWSVAVQKDR